MADAVIDPKRVEGLGPAETVVAAVGRFTDHLVHNRPGVVVADGRTNIGVRWQQATWRKQEDGTKVVFLCTKGVGKKAKSVETRLGLLSEDGTQVVANGKVMGEFRLPGLFPEVALWMYKQIADVFAMDADFAAHWASWSYTQDRKDLKTMLAAFMLAQPHSGEPVLDNGEILFHDDDFRAVGEAMMLHRQKGQDLSIKQLLLIGQVLRLPAVHQLNREMGFTASAKNPNLRRYRKTVTKWLRYRENNPRMLEGIAKSAQSRMVEDLAKSVRYKPQSQEFFKALRWKQGQAKDGHRTIGLDMELEAAESWADLSEGEICERIIADQPHYKLLVGMLPNGLTRAIMAAAVEAGSLSNKDLIILTPTLEDLGLLTVEPVATAWKKACALADDQRARNIARNVKTKEVTEALEEAADVATAKAIEKVTKNLRIYFIIDKSASMQGAIEMAKRILSKFVGGFPLDRTHVSIFNTMGSEVLIQAPRSAAVAHALGKHRAGGGTAYLEGVRALQHHKPGPDEDALFIFAGDEQGEAGTRLAEGIRATGIEPVAFGLLKFGNWGSTVTDGAKALGIPCFQIEEAIFDDPYAVTQTLTNLIAATPVGKATAARPVVKRETLVETILRTELLVRPNWAA